MLNELCSWAEPSIGLLYRWTEGLTETRPIQHISGWLSRTDYVAHLQTEGMITPLTGRFTASNKPITPLLAHMSTVANHTLNICCSIGDTGCISHILWGFEDRENIYTWLERRFGARLHIQIDMETSSSTDPDMDLLIDPYIWCSRFDSISDLMLLRLNVVRWQGIIPVDFSTGMLTTITGPLLQSSGLAMDVRPECTSYTRSLIATIHGGSGACSLTRLFLRLYDFVLF